MPVQIRHTLVLLSILFTMVLIASCGSESGGTDSERESSSDAPKNLNEAVNAHLKATYDLPAGDRPPEDMNAEATELFDQGVQLFRFENRAADGIALIEQSVALDPRNPIAYSELSLFYVNQPTKALEHLQNGLAHCPESPSVHFHIANVFSDLSDTPAAIKHLLRAEELGYPAKASVFFNLGNQYLKQERNDDAIAAYRRALDHDEHHHGARKNLVVVYVRSDQQEKARAEIEKLVSLDPDGEQSGWVAEAMRRIGP